MTHSLAALEREDIATTSLNVVFSCHVAPMWKMEGRFDDVVGLKVARAWPPRACAGVRLWRRSDALIWLDAFVSGTEVQQAARRLAQGLETR